MPRRQINQYSRIQVEFEYRSNNYLNSLIFLYDEVSIGSKLKVRLNAYSNQDAKNQPYLQNLSGEQKRFLAGIGDSIQNAYTPNIAADTFAAGKVLYRIIDTLVGSTLYDSVYVYSPDPLAQLYSVTFSYVGTGKGDYTISPINANGRVYQWVAPVAGQHQGDYSAVSLLITPKMQQLFALTTTYQIDSLKKISLELAASNKDPNLFSDKDNNTHWGGASKLNYDEQRFFGKKDSLQTSTWSMQNSLSYEHVQSKFKAIAPYRAVEFGRDWNVPLSGDSPDEDWVTVNSRLQHKRWGGLDYSFSYYGRDVFYTGYKNALGYKYHRGALNAGAGASLMTARDTFSKSSYFKPSAFAEYTIRPLLRSVLGASYTAEYDAIRNIHSDTLLPSSFFFDISSVYLKSLEQRKYNFTTTYWRRNDYLSYRNAFELQNHSNNVELRMNLSQWKDHRLAFTGTYRQLVVDQTTVAQVKPEESVLGRLEYNGMALRRAFSFSTLYEFGSGQEQKQSYTFIKVPAGQGVYNWIDYNNDGVEQMNEFVIALYPDQKLYIKVFTPTNEYNKVNNVSLNQTLNIEPSNLFRNKDQNGWSRFISRMSDQFSAQIVNKVLAAAGISAYNPLVRSYSDTSIIIANTSINNTFYFNRGSTRWGIDYNFLKNSGKQLLTYGITSTDNVQNLVKLRAALSRSVTLNLNGKLGKRSNLSGIADGSSYNQQFWSGEPALVWINRSVLRITTSVRYEERENAPVYGGETAKISSFNTEARYSQTTAGLIQLRFTYSNIEYSGLSTAPVSYVMLDGLKTGGNYLWYLSWQRRVSKGIELSIEYEGRKAGTDAVVNTGRMTLKAVL
jgi:hypothetical protein